MDTPLLIGIAMIFVGMLIVIASVAKSSTNVKAGGVLVVGPVPVVFGTDKETVLLAVVAAIIIMVLSVIFLSGMRS
jgi:uncharacterized protein (TIGR00304 family)